MKASRNIKVIGLALGERSLLLAELVGGERVIVRHLGEFVYPADIGLSQSEQLGAALGAFLKKQDVAARSAVVGIPARWLVVKPKDVPPADISTLNDLLRLQAEGDFSAELKDLVYDYAGTGSKDSAGQVLLIATQRQTIESIETMCDAAKLSMIAVMPTAVALGTASGRGSSGDAMVLAVGDESAELVAQRGGAASAIRHLRGPVAEKMFVGELRRAVASAGPTTAPVNGSTNGKLRDLIIWNGGEFDTAGLGAGLGVNLRTGDLSALGVEAPDESNNRQSPQYAGAVALALAAIHHDPAVNFLDSRLAPPPERRIPRWALAVVVILAIVGWSYHVLDSRQARLDKLNAELTRTAGTLKTAQAFVAKVSFAQGWHGGSPRYLDCIRDLTLAMPSDRVTYATNLVVRETPKPPSQSESPTSSEQKPQPPPTLTGTLTGKTSNQERVQALIDRMRKMPNFVTVNLGGTADIGKGREVAFTVLFVYAPPRIKPSAHAVGVQ